jgi:hypothetical protein
MIREVTYADALVSLCPGAAWSSDGTLAGLEWLDTEQKKPSNKAITAEIARIKVERERTAYRRARAEAYPYVGDQLDALFHAGVFPPEMEAKIRAIKEQYPKPTAQ